MALGQNAGNFLLCYTPSIKSVLALFEQVGVIPIEVDSISQELLSCVVIEERGNDALHQVVGEVDVLR